MIIESLLLIALMEATVYQPLEAPALPPPLVCIADSEGTYNCYPIDDNPDKH